MRGIFTGTALRRVLPENHLSKDTQDVVRLRAGLTATERNSRKGITADK